MNKVYKKEIHPEDGRTITIETGKLAKQADGAVVLTMGKTMLLATVVAATEIKPDVDFMPLQVEYQEKFASVGRFPGGFIKREGRPGDNEILIARLVDRCLRPLFPDDYHADTFVTIQLISGDLDTYPDSLAGLAASSALAVSDVPFNGPISEVRVSRIDGKFYINPTVSQNEKADIDIIVGATMDNIMMVEGEMDEVSEADMLEAIKIAHEEIKKHCQVQLELMEETGKTEKREYDKPVEDEELKKQLFDAVSDKIREVALASKPKQERSQDFKQIKKDFAESLPEIEDKEEAARRDFLVDHYFHDAEKEVVRQMILNDRKRLDGREMDEIRPIWCEVDYLPTAHGSAVFTRGETQSLTTVTLGTKLDEKIIDDVLTQGRDKFLLHYNFPPFSTGDPRPVRGVSRREVGHGNLAHRALKRMIPIADDNPYTLRVVSDILESNGSSSMATVCAGTLALMDAGINIKKPVSGIAMGLITEPGNQKYAVLSDILGDEDHLGDMDFKVAGTKDGITATQMDIKVDGLSYEILEQALEQARKGRLHILEKIVETLPEPREDYKPHVPRIDTVIIPKDLIGAIIGPGGKIVQEIQAKSDTTITIEERAEDGKGVVNIIASNQESRDIALKMVRAIVEEPEVGQVYEGTIKSIVSFGAFIEILPGKEGLLHISEIDHKRIRAVEDELKEGETIEVKLIDIDDKTGKLKLSRKALIPNPNPKPHSPRPKPKNRY